MDGNIIKSFLVGLGFDIDETGLAKFNKAIASATIKVAALYAGIRVAAAGIFLGISKISEGFEQLGYEYRIIAPMLNKTLMLRNALLAAYRAAGIQIENAVKESVKFNFSLAKTKFALEAIYKSVGLKFLPLLTKQMDIFRKQIYANMPKIQEALEKFVRFIFKAFEATTILGTRLFSVLERVYDFFVQLDKATNGWSTIILGVIAAWKLLNLSFLATPLGLLITGLTTLLALWDDFKTFKEGGQSLINWGSQTTQILVGVAGAVAAVAAAIGAVIVALKAYAVAQAIVNALLLLNPFGLMIAGITALIGLLTVLVFKWDNVKKSFTDFFGGFGSSILKTLSGNGPDTGTSSGNGPGGGIGNALSSAAGSVSRFVTGSPNIGANVAPGNNPAVSPLVNPVGTSNISNSSSHQSVQQETNIIVQGTADAHSTGRAIASEQGKVNFDMARNMKGSTR